MHGCCTQEGETGTPSYLPLGFTDYFVSSEEQDQSQISDDGQDAEVDTVGQEGAEGNAESGDVEEEVYQTVGVTIKNKPYLCTYENCDKAFQWKSYLERHIQSHTGIKPSVSERKKRGPRKRKNADGTEDDTPKLYVCNGKKDDFSPSGSLVVQLVCC